MDSKPNTPAGNLLEGFPAAGYADWKALVEGELKGAPFDKKMLSTTYEGITLQPLYRKEDTASLAHVHALPGFAPYVRGGSAAGFLGRVWEVSQEIAEPAAAAFNNIARTGLDRGLTALNIVLDKATRAGADPDSAQPSEVGCGGLSIAALCDLERALEGIDLGRVPLFIRSGASGMPVAALLTALARKRGVDLGSLRGCIEVDPLGVLAHEGRLPQSLAGAYREMAALTRWGAAHAPQVQTVCVHSRPWHEAGGNAVQELAFALATGVEYVRALQARGVAPAVAAPRLRFAFTLGCQFFTEIAKLRAFRMLWSRATDAMGVDEDARRARIHVRTSLWNKTVLDPYVNILRTTVEAFAGVLGGCDSMQVGAFDEVVRTPDDFSQRVARNTQLILRDECVLDRVIDPAGGSWYVESLTQELASRAWTLFQDVEKRGGMAAAIKEGWPQAAVAGIAAEKLKNVARRRDSIIGINQYANVGERLLAPKPADPESFHRRRVQQISAARTEAEDAAHDEVLARLAAVLNKDDEALVEAAIAAIEAGATLGEVTRTVRIQDQPEGPVRAVTLTRASCEIERLRLAVEARTAQADRRPRVHLVNMGPPKQHRARAEFSRGFLQVAGFEISNPPGALSIADAVAAAIQSGAEAVCLCSTDETYPELVPQLVSALRAGNPGIVVILAGYPQDHVDALRAAGVQEFIHLRANALEVLTSIAARMGVTL
jgi:methylmalonyl-CoA mutase